MTCRVINLNGMLITKYILIKFLIFNRFVNKRQLRSKHGSLFLDSKHKQNSRHFGREQSKRQAKRVQHLLYQQTVQSSLFRLQKRLHKRYSFNQAKQTCD